MKDDHHFDVYSTRCPTAQRKERLAIFIERNGIEVVCAIVPLPPAPDSHAKPPRCADDEMIRRELPEMLADRSLPARRS